jgi:N-acyl-D-amino-acid deacylase
MQALLQEALDAGVVGFSTGLGYETAESAPTDEIVELAKLLKAAGAIHTTHMRDESDHVLESLDETFDIGRQTVCLWSSPIRRRRRTSAFSGESPRSHEARATTCRPRRLSLLRIFDDPQAEWVGEAEVMIAWSKAAPEQAGRLVADVAPIGAYAQEGRPPAAGEGHLFPWMKGMSGAFSPFPIL